MSIYASIDIGTNSVRLLIVSKEQAGLNTLYRDIAVTRIGEGIGQTASLKPEAIMRTTQAVSKFYKIAQNNKSKEIYVFATSAVRDAVNKQEFIDAVNQELGLIPEILSGVEEAELSYIGALDALKKVCCNPIVIDIGGGSTEVIYKHEQIVATSIPVGAVRLYEKSRPKDELYKLFEDVINKIPFQEYTIIGVGGTVTSFAAMLQELEPYDPEKVHGYKMKKIDVQILQDKLYQLPLDERKKIIGLQTNRADIIPYGGEILCVLLDLLKAKELIVSESDLLQGRILKI